MTLRAYLQILLKRWRILTACALLVLVGAGAFTYLTPPTYAATSTAFVSINTAGSSTDTSIYQSSQFAMQRVKSYTEVVKSPDVLQPVIDELDLGMTVPELRRVVTAENEVDTVLLSVTATDRSPTRAQAIANAVNTQLGQAIERLETPRAGGVSPVKVTQTVPAATPRYPISPRVSLNLALGLIAGLALGVVVAVIREQQDTTVKGEELEQLTGRAPLALVGVIPNAKTQPLITMEGHGRGVEEFRSLRANLQFVDVDQPPRVIVVTSPLAGEGKTTTACNLAIALAQSSLKVCLVEADMRRPMAANLLGIDGSIGLSNVVAGQLDLADALMPWHRGLLQFLAAGTTPPDPSKLLGSKNMEALLESLRAEFDYVIIDAPPVLPVSDAAVLAHSTDGAVLVTRYGKTRREHVTRSVADLAAVQARLIGAVITMVPARGQRSLRGHDEDYAALAAADNDWVGASTPLAQRARRTPSPARGRHEHPQDAGDALPDVTDEVWANGSPTATGATSPRATTSASWFATATPRAATETTRQPAGPAPVGSATASPESSATASPAISGSSTSAPVDDPEVVSDDEVAPPSTHGSATQPGPRNAKRRRAQRRAGSPQGSARPQNGAGPQRPRSAQATQGEQARLDLGDEHDGGREAARDASGDRVTDRDSTQDQPISDKEESLT
ncbi:tyrosine-protein kinase domain-containing protein [Pedococcus soli]